MSDEIAAAEPLPPWVKREFARLRAELEAARVKYDEMKTRAENVYAAKEILVSDLAAARRSLEAVREFIAFIGETYETSNLPSEGKVTRCQHCRRKVDGNVDSPTVCDKFCLGRRARAFLAPPVAPPPPCASWCGKDGNEAPSDASGWRSADMIDVLFCREACVTAGAPRNPVKP